ncbi:YeiH family protein [Nocardiopsis salina]|uniref:YeiH family protein n=1 Tax=Nocardiopsis salina TaxID=245836 RepID=UPI000475AE40|nr:putative sulfate exporter family transporter [Nocardiopsis salina]
MSNPPLSPGQAFGRLAPGLLVCFLVGAVSTAAAVPFDGVSGLVIAIVVGIVWRNSAPWPQALAPGVAVAAKPVLRVGIVLLGLQLLIGDVRGLGVWVIVGVTAAVGLTFWATMAVGRRLGLSPNQRLLVASGFSICGAAAVAGTDAVTDSEEREVATAVAMVVVFGTAMIPLMPALGALSGFTPEQTGLLIGLSTHEVAQVVAAGGIAGSGALAVAVTVKLARVLFLVPVLAGIAWSRRRGEAASGTAVGAEQKKRPPLVPLFVLGFIACVALRSTGVLPEPALEAAHLLQTLALSTAMFALGLNVHVKALLEVGGRPVALSAVSTLVIVLIGWSAVVMPELLGFDPV